MTATFSLRYIDKVQQIAKTMNARVNRSINMAPKDVNYKNQREVVLFMKKMRERENTKIRKNDIDVGTFVRVSVNKTNSMDKGYLPNWSDEIYKVTKIHTLRKYPMYQLEDFEGKKIEGNFYASEIQRVEKTQDTLYRIDKILKHRVRNGVKEILVSWKNYSAEHNSWISEADLVGQE